MAASSGFGSKSDRTHLRTILREEGVALDVSGGGGEGGGGGGGGGGEEEDSYDRCVIER